MPSQSVVGRRISESQAPPKSQRGSFSHLESAWHHSSIPSRSIPSITAIVAAVDSTADITATETTAIITAGSKTNAVNSTATKPAAIESATAETGGEAAPAIKAVCIGRRRTSDQHRRHGCGDQNCSLQHCSAPIGNKKSSQFCGWIAISHTFDDRIPTVLRFAKTRLALFHSECKADYTIVPWKAIPVIDSEDDQDGARR